MEQRLLMLEAARDYIVKLGGTPGPEMYNEIADVTGDMFKADNALFSRDRFLFACKPGSNVKARTAHLKIA